MSLQNVQAQLGNLLAAMPLKVQKVDPSFLTNATPPFEGALTSDAQGQFYVSQINDQGNLAWQQILDKTSVADVAISEFISSFEFPVGYSGARVDFGEDLVGDDSYPFSSEIMFFTMHTVLMYFIYSSLNLNL